VGTRSPAGAAAAFRAEEGPVSAEFLVTSLIVAVTPGTGVLVTLTAALTHGARAGVVATVGCTLGIVPHVLAAVTGLAALLHTSALAFQVVKYLGVAYLLYLAWRTLRDSGPLHVPQDSTARSTTQVIVSAVLVNLLNPKLTIFFFAFLPQFVARDAASALPQMLALSAVFMLVTFVVFAVYGCCAAAVRRHVLERPGVLTWLRRTFAAAFVAMGARLAVAER
jgi:threonine/homoserine/homoserine lactone efflux protein